MNGIKWMIYYLIVLIHLRMFCFFLQNKKKNFYYRLSSDEEALRTRLYVKLKEIMLQVNLDEVTPKFVST